MNNNFAAIEEGYRLVLDELNAMRQRYLSDSIDNPEDYDGIRASDVYIWFIEGFGS